MASVPHPSAGPARPAERRASRAQRAYVPLGLLAVGVLALARVRIALDLAVEGRGADPGVASYALAARFAPEFLHALVLGMVAAAVTVLTLSRPGARAGRALLAFLFAAAVLAVALSGWPTASPRDVPGAGELAGWLSSAGVLAVLGAALLTGAGLALRAREGLAELLGSGPAIAIAALIGLGPPVGWMVLAQREVPTMPVRTLVRDLLAEPAALQPLAGFAPGELPRVATLAPAVDFRSDTGDKPALLLPPGREVGLLVRPEDGAVRLRAAAGVDLGVHPRGEGGFTLRFQVERNGRLVLDELRPVRAGLEPSLLEWRHAGGPGGLALEPGDRVVLRTLLEPEGAELAPPADELKAGFGGMVLERVDATPRTLATPERPNVLLVVMDTLRADRMSCYGYHKPTTPHADALAARGTLFEEAFATSSWTWPATASILTGLDPEQHGVTSNESCTLARSNETLAEALQAQGFTTAAFSANPLIAPERYFDQGFEHFDSAGRMRMSDELIDDVLAWIDENADLRFFLYLHLADPHPPHRPLESELARLGGEEPDDYPRYEHEGEPIDGMNYYTSLLMRAENSDEHGAPRLDLVPESHQQFIHDVYDASVGTGDHHVGLVLRRLARLGLEESTVIAFTSDHGEELFDHGSIAHGHTLHRELVRVPLVIAGPGVPAGRRVSHPVSNRHVAPTLARVGGAELGAVPDALDLTADLAGAPERALFSTEKGHWNGNKPERIFGLRAGRHVLHWSPEGRSYGTPRGQALPGGERRLYDAYTDAEETRDLSSAEAEAAEALLAELRRALAEQRGRRLAGALGVGRAGKAQLEDLGYTGTSPEGEDGHRER